MASSFESSRGRPQRAVDPLEFVEDEEPLPGVPANTDMYLIYGSTWILLRRFILEVGRDFA
jgi:hypothetical protein